MASPQQFDDPSPGHHDDSAPRLLRLRLVPWDVVSLLVLVALLAAVAFGTDWYARLFGFLKDVCTGDCPPDPGGGAAPNGAGQRMSLDGESAEWRQRRAVTTPKPQRGDQHETQLRHPRRPGPVVDAADGQPSHRKR